MAEAKKQYTVFVDDNYHYMDESERYQHGVFETAEEAVAACEKIVDESLQWAYHPGMTSGELMEGYVTFGEDPWISPPPEGGFSARDYARGRCKELCRAADERSVKARGRPIDAAPPELTALKPVIDAVLARPSLPAEKRPVIDQMRAQLEAIPGSFPDRSFTLIVKPSLGHAGGFFASVFHAELTPAAFRVSWGRFEKESSDPTRLAELRISFYAGSQPDERVGNPSAMLEAMARAAADETFMLIVYSHESE
jgi:hypothetical protein